MEGRASADSGARQDYILPARKASPPIVDELSFPTSEQYSGARALHSPLSPLSPESSLYPDGVISPLWLEKHQDQIPSVFIPCFELYTGKGKDEETRSDNDIIGAINDLKKCFGTSTSTNLIGSGLSTETSGRRTKFAMILIAERSMLHSPDIDERVNNIRRSVSLENNSTFFFLPSPSSGTEIQAFARNVQYRMFPSSLEYYRDLSKHARRKKKQPIPPPTVAPTRSSNTLSDNGWAVRYEFKLGVFAEYRREMDAAARNYESAYEGLSEIFATTTSWSPRWTEVRLFADMLTIRVVRCLLWMENWTAAVRRWEYHINKMRVLVDSKGKGTET